MPEPDFNVNEETKSTKDAKYNLFRFQDHINDQLRLSAIYFKQGDYSSLFTINQIIYNDVIGFFDDKEIEKIDKLYSIAEQANFNMNNYLLFYNSLPIGKKRHVGFKPPSYNLYVAVINFKKELMRLMTKHQMLIPLKPKGSEGAADQ